MREILFRGKRKKNDKRWVEGDLLHGYFGFGITNRYYAGSSFEVVPETVGQYTGLTDKNGVKAFEGDILQVKQNGETEVVTCVIYFGEYIGIDSAFDDYRCIGFYLKADECCSIGALLDSDLEFEVIGNIYDNPELLEVEDHE